jgi:hypothetical protein
MARFVVTVDLPTPPFPEETAMIRPRPGYVTGVGGVGGFGAPAGSPITGSVRPPAGFGGGRRFSRRRRRRLCRVLHIDPDVGDALHRLERLADLPREHGVVLRAEEEGDADLAIAGGGDVTDLLRLVEGGAGAGIGERGERLGEACLERIGHQYDGKVLAQEFW